MKPTRHNQHGSMSKRINPLTGKRFDWETQQLAAAVDHGVLQDGLRDAEKMMRKMRMNEAAIKSRGDLLEFTKFTMPDPAAPTDVARSVYEPTKVHEVVASDLGKFIRGEMLNDDGTPCTQLIFCMPPRHGKSIAHDQPILTPEGWRTHGDLEPGDYVFGPDGKPTRVIAVSPDVAEVVPVTLTNGEVIFAHPNHEWVVYDRPLRGWRVMETKEIARRKLRSGPVGRGGRFVLQIPDAEALQFPERELLMPPYVLGAWLGDGTSNAPRLAHAESDAEVLEAIGAEGYPANNTWRQRQTGVCYATFWKTPFRRHLKSLGVFGDKHIPECYLRSSVEQRLQLLAGLIDTDGHVERKTGRVRFITSSEKLRDGVYDLAVGLGFRPYITSTPPATSSSGVVGKKTIYHIGFQPNLPIPTRIPRKKIARFAVRRRIGIASVGGVTFKRARSICVEREDGLYVVGKQCVVTKNTQLGTKSLTAWASGLHPEWDIAVASYSDTMAQDMGADTRAILQTKRFQTVFPGYELRKGGAAKDNIQTEKGGRLVFVGRGGALTGRGMCLGIGDDLFKDHEEARSQAIRDQAWNWFTKVFMTRRMGPKLVILTMTRWHSDDIIGRITDPDNDCYNAIEAKRWKIIRLPAIAEDDDPLGRPPGEALWPERFDLDFLHSQQRIDPLGFAALYQQTPTVADGTLFRRETIMRYEPEDLPDNLRFYATSDHAVGTKQRNDPSCFLKGGVDGDGTLWLTDIFWQRIPSDRAVEMMLEMGAGGEEAKRPLLWWAEQGHISKSIGPFLRKRMLETGRFLNIQEITPVADKEQRAQSIAARVALGKVRFPKGMIWDKAVEEMLAFPNGLRDDFVDALSLFGLGLTSQFGKRQETKKRKEPRFGTWAWIKADQLRKEQAGRQRANGGF